jgi:threonine/homoserine/homoserine lactone efflux protein
MIPDAATFGLFAAASLALYVSPGPDMLYIASRSIGQGRRAGLLSACGTCSGLLAHTTAAALGLTALFSAAPAAFLVIKWLGVAYLLYLGIGVLTGRGHSWSGAGPAVAGADPWRIYAQGLLVNLLNPKIALFFLAFLPQFAGGAGDAFAARMVLLGALFTAGGLLWTAFLALAFGAAGDWLASRPAVWRWQRRFTGSVLIGLAAHLALSERR